VHVGRRLAANTNGAVPAPWKRCAVADTAQDEQRAMEPHQLERLLLMVVVVSLVVERDAMVGSVVLRLETLVAVLGLASHRAQHSWSRTPTIRGDARMCVEMAWNVVESVVAAKILPPDPANLPKAGHCHHHHGSRCRPIEPCCYCAAKFGRHDPTLYPSIHSRPFRAQFLNIAWQPLILQ
jgi:hypothetical protein